LPLFRELKRRNVFRAAVAYVVTAWLIIQVVETIFPAFGFSDAAIRIAVITLAIGFVPAVAMAWAFELTPEGLKPEKEVDYSSTAFRQFGKRVDRATLVVLAIAVAYFMFDKFILDPARDFELVNATTQRVEQELLNRVSEKSIAVLPFVNLSADPDQAYFSDGLTEELLNLLAGLDGLKVAGRSSSFYFKDKLGDIPFKEIGRQLEVAYLLEGSVRKGGDKFRVTAQLSKAEDGFRIWSKTWDRKLDDVFAVQDEIASAVAAQTKIILLDELPHQRRLNPESYELMLRGRYLYSRRTEGDMKKTIELFERAVEIDPNNAAAWIGLVPLYVRWVDPPRPEDALRAAQTGVKLDPGNPEAWSRLAFASERNGDRKGAAETWQHAVELGANNQLIQGQLAGEYYRIGNLEGALEANRRALQIDPLSLLTLTNFAAMLLEADQFEEAEKYAAKSLELSPENPAGLANQASALLLSGRAGEALAYVRQIPEGDDESFTAGIRTKLMLMALVHSSLGNIEIADDTLERFRSEFGDQFPVGVAYIHAWRNETDAAFDWLDRSLELYPEPEISWTWAPWLNSLDKDPRWADLMARWPSPAPSPFL
jgi:serine/threonine-protein kinase